MLTKKKISRSRTGCHRCKRLKVKCTEEKPQCVSCIKARVKCDYSLKLTWGGRPYKNQTRRQAQSLVPVTFVENTMSPAIDPHASPQRMVKKESCELELGPGSYSLDPTPNLNHDFAQRAGSHNGSQHAHTPNGTTPRTVSHAASPARFSPGDFILDGQEHGDVKSEYHTHPSVPGYTLNLPSTPLETHPEYLSGLLRSLPAQSASGSVTHSLSHLLSDLLPSSVSLAKSETSQLDDSLTLEKLSGEQVGTNSLLSAFFAAQAPQYADLKQLLELFPSPRQQAPEANYSMDLAKIDCAFPLSPKLPLAHHLYLSHQKAGESEDKPGSGESRLEPSLRMFTDSIPPLLEPLPEILLKVPYYRQLLHFWVNVAANNLVPAPSLYKENPFKVLLPRMAMHYQGLLTTILAFAARARANLENLVETHLKIIDQLLGRLCNELVKQLQDETEATSDGTLAQSLLLLCYEVCHLNDFVKHRTHTTGASQIMKARTRKVLAVLLPDDENLSQTLASLLTSRNESDIAYFLVRWFTYVDVVGALSLTRDRENYLRAYRTSEFYTPVELIPNFDELSDVAPDIDYLLGFDARLLPHFVNILLLVDQIDKYLADPDNDHTCLPQHVVAAAMELREKFTKKYEEGELDRLLKLDEMIERRTHGIPALMAHDNTLRSTNRLYYDTGLLNLYRRVLLLPRLLSLVQDLVAEMTGVLEACIEPGSAALICTIFCLFCAGCDTLDPAKQQFYAKRFYDLAQAGNINASKSLVIMARCWDTGEDWITAANNLDIDLVLM